MSQYCIQIFKLLIKTKQYKQGSVPMAIVLTGKTVEKKVFK